eukprot:GHVU01106663.1.p1 GENE.GHVU01106663.1~~GHVU01106663.1.p1  ORF type:complete len:317 (-),score=81.84 GHVU01106663.1:147-1097(-)
MLQGGGYWAADSAEAGRGAGPAGDGRSSQRGGAAAAAAAPAASSGSRRMPTAQPHHQTGRSVEEREEEQQDPNINDSAAATITGRGGKKRWRDWVQDAHLEATTIADIAANTLQTGWKKWQQEIGDQIEELKACESECQQLEAEIRELAEGRRRRHEQLSKAEQTEREARAEAAHLEQEVRELQLQLDGAKLQNQQAARELEEGVRRGEADIEQQKKEQGLLQRALGLEITAEGGATVFTFSRIDDQLPTRKFRFALRYNSETGAVKGERCDPPVAGFEEVVALLDQGAIQLAEVLVRMRKKFKARSRLNNANVPL